MSSGLAANNTGERQDFSYNHPAGEINNLTLLGFDTVELGGALIQANNISVVANNVKVNTSLKAENAILLSAASFDANNTRKGVLGGTVIDFGGWRNLEGVITFADQSGVDTLTANDFRLYSGVTVDDSAKREDIDLSDRLLANDSVSRIDVAGFNKVTLPVAITSLSGENSLYRVRAQSIDGTAITNINAKTLTLDAGRFTISNSVMAYSLNPELNGENAVAWRASSGVGVLALNDGIQIQSDQLSLTSGTINGSRPDLSLGALRPYNVSAINEVSAYTTARGWYLINIQGFNEITLPKHAIKAELIDIRANIINVNDDINAGGGGWWPRPFYLHLQAGAFGDATGKVNFVHPSERTIVLRSSSIPTEGDYGANDTGRGFHSVLSVISPGGGDFDALLGYKQEDYSAGGFGEYSGLHLQGFDSTRVQLEEASADNTDPRDIVVARGSSSSLPISNRIQIVQRQGATGWVSIHNNLVAPNKDVVINAQGGGIRMGEQIITTPSLDVQAGANSAINTNVDQIKLKITDGTLVINEANNLRITNTGANNDAGSIEINTRGELVLVSNLSRTNANSSVTLRSDAEQGRQIKVDETDFANEDTDLNDLFANANNGTYGERGGDGLGAIRVDAGAAQLVIPIFARVVRAQVEFTVPAGTNLYYMIDGTPLVAGDVVAAGESVLVNRSLNLPSAFESIGTEGVIRSTARVLQGGYTVTQADALRFYNLDFSPIAVGTNLAADSRVLYKPEMGLPTNLTDVGITRGGEQVYAISGYNAGPVSRVTRYTSLGLGAQTFGGLTLTAHTITNDTPVDVSDDNNYYGNPLSGASEGINLNMSGQFYTLELGNLIQVPHMFNAIAATGDELSASQNGWDKSWGNSSISTNGGDLRIFSGPSYALDGAGFIAGSAADLTVFNNPSISDFSKDKEAKIGAFSLSSGAGDLVVLGFRDVVVEPSGTLNSTGNVTIGAARDLVFKEDVQLGGNNTLTTLVAGGMLSTRKADNGYNTIKGDRVLLVAGGGVDVQTEVNLLAGSLQDNPQMVGGQTPTGTFSVRAINELIIGTITNELVRDVNFNQTAGIQYVANTELVRNGISSTPNIDGSYGQINLAAPGIRLQADVNAGSQTANAQLEATTGSIISDPQGGNRPTLHANQLTLLATASDQTIGTAGSFINTQVNSLNARSHGSIFLNELSDITLAAQSVNGAVTVKSIGDLILGEVVDLTGITAKQAVILAAGHNKLAGDGSGGQIKVVRPDSFSGDMIRTTEAIRLFSGSVATTESLGDANSSLTNLYLWAIGNNPINVAANTAFDISTSLPNGPQAQVFFREKIALQPSLNSLTYTYGDVTPQTDQEWASRLEQTVVPGLVTQRTSAGNLVYTTQNFFNELMEASVSNQIVRDGFIEINETGYDFNFKTASTSNFDLTQAQAKLIVLSVDSSGGGDELDNNGGSFGFIPGSPPLPPAMPTDSDFASASNADTTQSANFQLASLMDDNEAACTIDNLANCICEIPDDEWQQRQNNKERVELVNQEEVQESFVTLKASNKDFNWLEFCYLDELHVTNKRSGGN